MTSPFSLLEFAPMDAKGGAVTQAEYLAGDGTGKASLATGVEATKAAFITACNRGESNKADHLFQWMWQHMPKQDCFNLMMDIAIVIFYLVYGFLFNIAYDRVFPVRAAPLAR